MSKHTPGPWEIVEKTDPQMISHWSIKIGEKTISFFPYVYQYADKTKTCGGYVSCPEWHANARLIAAAPELLEALEISRNYVEAVYLNTPNPKKARNYSQCLDIIDAAIAKATGEQA